jgi:hypothetical protein
MNCAAHRSGHPKFGLILQKNALEDVDFNDVNGWLRMGKCCRIKSLAIC